MFFMKRGRKQYTKEYLLSELIRAYKLLEYSPTQEFIDFNPDFPSRNAYRRQFGTFSEAMIEAGLPLCPQGAANPNHPKNPNHPLYKTPKKQAAPSLKLRFKIFNRDNFTCQYCGRTIKDGIKLEIDHILPVSKDGKTTSKNLITSCFDCNRGKRDFLLNEHYKNKKPDQTVRR